jgi:hypothetical protein
MLHWYNSYEPIIKSVVLDNDRLRIFVHRWMPSWINKNSCRVRLRKYQFDQFEGILTVKVNLLSGIFNVSLLILKKIVTRRMPLKYLGSPFVEYPKTHIPLQ